MAIAQPVTPPSIRIPAARRARLLALVREQGAARWW
jgi:hypothetical protein